MFSIPFCIGGITPSMKAVVLQVDVLAVMLRIFGNTVACGARSAAKGLNLCFSCIIWYPTKVEII